MPDLDEVLNDARAALDPCREIRRERDRYRMALEQIVSRSYVRSWQLKTIAREALGLKAKC